MHVYLSALDAAPLHPADCSPPTPLPLPPLDLPWTLEQLRVTETSEKEERRGRPPGLNTVEMLKTASSSLNMGPAHAMQVCVALWRWG